MKPYTIKQLQERIHKAHGTLNQKQNPTFDFIRQMNKRIANMNYILRMTLKQA